MKTLQFVNPAQCFLDIGQDSLLAFNGNAGVELPLERLPDGKLTDKCKQSLVTELQKFIARKPWQPRARVFCAIPARGVSLRRMSLPASGREELQRLLPLQIEREFPLSPDQLAWGAQNVNGVKAQPGGPMPKQELLVAAVKKDSLEEYAAIISACGATPVFTLAALARSYLCPQPPGLYTVLSLGRTGSELITIERGVPVAVRAIAWGVDDLARGELPLVCENAPSLGPPAAGRGREASFDGTGPPLQPHSVSCNLAPLLKLINGQSLGRKVFVTGILDPPAKTNLTRELAQNLNHGVECEPVDLMPGVAGSEAILGLLRVLDRQSGLPPLVLQLKRSDRNRKVIIAQQFPLKWVGLVLGLLALALILPSLEALLLKSHLEKKLAAIKSDSGRLDTIDRELGFLQYLKENEPPYLDALLVLAKAAPPGTRFDAVSMNRRGEVSLRGSLRDGQQVAELRSKLIDSGFFASVGIEEQSPGPDRQKVTVRMSAQWKPANLRKTLPSEPAKASLDAKSPAPPAGQGASPTLETPAPVQKSPALKPTRN
jgi:hypothetical protein